MRFHAYDVRTPLAHVHHVSLSTLQPLHGVIATRGLIASARAIAVVGTVTILPGIARLLRMLPATLDALITIAAAIVWMLWIDREVQQ